MSIKMPANVRNRFAKKPIAKLGAVPFNLPIKPREMAAGPVEVPGNLTVQNKLDQNQLIKMNLEDLKGTNPVWLVLGLGVVLLAIIAQIAMFDYWVGMTVDPTVLANIKEIRIYSIIATFALWAGGMSVALGWKGDHRRVKEAQGGN